jgi:hypothetical protein
MNADPEKSFTRIRVAFVNFVASPGLAFIRVGSFEFDVRRALATTAALETKF